MSFTDTYIKAITTNYFGYDVGIIAEALCAGPKTIQALFQKVSPFLKNKKLFRQQLTLLYWNHIVKCEEDSNSGVERYSICFENVFRFAMLPSMLPVLEELAGPGALILAKAMIKAGRISFSDIVRQAKHDSNDNSEEYDFFKIFADLVGNKVFMRTQDRLGDTDINPFLLPITISDGKSRIAEVVKIDAKMEEFEVKFAEDSADKFSQNQGAAKLEVMRRKKRQELHAEAEKIKSTDSDGDVLWRINFNIFDRIYRDRLLLEILINDVGIDDIGEKIMRAAFGFCLKLQDGNASQPCAKFFSRKDLESVLRGNADITPDDYEATLYLVSSSADRFIRKVGEGAGGLYTIDYVEGMRMLLVRTLKSMIQSKYENPNDKADEEKRGFPPFIFTLLLKKGLVEEEKLAEIFKHPDNEVRQELYRLRNDGFINVITKDTSYEFNPMSSQFLYGVDLLKVNLNQFQKVLQYQSNYINRRLKEKEEISGIKSVKNKVRKMIDYAKQNITDESELADTIEDISNEFDQGKRRKLRQYRQFRDYLKKVEMMLNETIWILHRNCEMEQRKRREEGGNNIQRSKKRAADASEKNGGSDAKRPRVNMRG